ncbi:hypothetical protein SKAU_G00077660 [Synaphobranchus kaupii]|uniref:Immunoglobulin V-set domain-containing protein n=1 Tax=Synaphobranchus kaupii TaxID=118154 RepID=A0A9Q1G8I1_SYNKA|nr:hypothetical protein SKAU_G00077660 [Synaphobranchus kaupii]
MVCFLGADEALITVNSTINGSATLPSGSPYTSPSKVQWSIDNKVIAYYEKPDYLEIVDRFQLNKGNGFLEVKQLQMADTGIYTVEVSHDKDKKTAKVKLMIYEKANTPKLELLSNISGPGFCNLSVRCTTLNGLWVVSLCELTRANRVCRVTARNDSTNSALLLVTATKDAINCSSSNPASTSSAPLLPVTRVCQALVPGEE